MTYLQAFENRAKLPQVGRYAPQFHLYGVLKRLSIANSGLLRRHFLLSYRLCLLLLRLLFFLLSGFEFAHFCLGGLDIFLDCFNLLLGESILAELLEALLDVRVVLLKEQ